jgi:hypothetical protein
MYRVALLAVQFDNVFRTISSNLEMAVYNVDINIIIKPLHMT